MTLVTRVIIVDKGGSEVGFGELVLVNRFCWLRAEEEQEWKKTQKVNK